MAKVVKRGKKWYIDYIFEGRRIKRSVGPNKKAAEDALAAIKADILRGEYRFRARRTCPRFKEFAKLYLSLSKATKKETSYQRDVLSIKHLTKKFDNKKLSAITHEDVENYQVERQTQVTPTTVNRELACLRHLFNKAIEYKKTTVNPVKGVKFSKEIARLRYLKDDEKEKLFDVCLEEPIKSIVMIALSTGMRLGEIISLRWRDIDFHQKMIHIEMTKNGERRDVPMNHTSFNTLMRQDEYSDGNYVFHKNDGSPYINDTISKWFKKICNRGGIENFRFHDLRHTFASQLVMNGTDLKTVQELLGHKSYQMTLRYAHLSPQFKRDAISRLDSWTGELKDDKVTTAILKNHLSHAEV